ncbi:MAG: hypothetical protein EPN36_11015 [Rhodanobacteraceae bacterium]|nr:MAG: hypothetical protein EPN36_11015 [Rhodanobacteraceae bacterium]
MLKLHTPILALALGLLAACSTGNQGGTYSSAFQHLSIDSNGNVIALAHDGSKATVTAAGALAINTKSIAVTPTQRQALENYHAAAIKLLDDGIATGKAGLSTGMHAIGAVVSGLASGNPDSIDAKVNARADKVSALAENVCTDLAQLYAAQGRVAAAIPAFKPYATIAPQEISDCQTH